MRCRRDTARVRPTVHLPYVSIAYTYFDVKYVYCHHVYLYTRAIVIFRSYTCNRTSKNIVKFEFALISFTASPRRSHRRGRRPSVRVFSSGALFLIVARAHPPTAVKMSLRVILLLLRVLFHVGSLGARVLIRV